MIKWTKPIGLIVMLIALTSTASAQAFQNISLEVTDISSGYVRNGLFIPVSNIAQVQNGIGSLSKEQAVELLGSPNDSASSVQDNNWFYNINLPLGGDDYLVCQYQVYFLNQLVSGFEWRRPQCGARYTELVGSEVHSLSADLLFGFDSANISPEGITAIRQLSTDVFQNFNNASIEVVGYADRLGDAAYNLTLSEKRAHAVSIALVESGVPPQWITYEGRGSSEPIVFCADNISRPQLISCLAENRRVNIVLN